jgi:hypothetical protein
MFTNTKPRRSMDVTCKCAHTESLYVNIGCLVLRTFNDVLIAKDL